MVDLRSGGLSCASCGTTLPTVVLTRRSRFAMRLQGDTRKHAQLEVLRVCKEDVDGPGAGTGLSAGSPSQSSSRLHRCKLLKIYNEASEGLATAVHSACKDVLFMSAAAHNLDERARSDVAILARGILRLDSRARQDVALLGSGFLKLDARAREDTEKLDFQARQKVQRLRYIVLGLQEIARVEAEEHWSDGALDADLRLADLRARRRVMEDAYVSVQILTSKAMLKALLIATREIVNHCDGQVVKKVHSALVSILQMREMEARDVKRRNSAVPNDNVQCTTGSAALDRLLELEEAYLSMASLLAEADGIDCTDPDELELVVATLLDMDEVAGGSGASLLAECATSPDVATRRALADALADAPSLWTLGNAGMGALQRLATDSNPTVAAAAAKAIEEFNQQWTLEDRKSFFFPGLSTPLEDSEPEDESEDV